MTAPRFICRLYPYDDFQKTLDEIGNFTKVKGRQEDEVIVFTGMYGLNGYMVWYVHQDLQNYDFATTGINLRLFLEGTTKMPYWTGKYRVVDVRFDSNESQYVVFAISDCSAKLTTPLTDYNVTSLKYDENRTAKDVLVDVLEKNNIFKIKYFTHPKESELVNYQYRYFNINEEWTVLDFINYICDENDFEWALRNGVLYVGKVLKGSRKRRSGRKEDKRRDRPAVSSFFYKLSGETRPMDINSHIEEEWRCVWAKHWVGGSGGTSRGCFTKIGEGTVDKKLYFNTLEGDYERNNASILLTHNSPSHYISLGNIMKDEGTPEYIDEVSMQTPLDLEKVTNPSEVEFDDGEGVVLLKEQITRTTPYLDNEGGLLFPKSYLEDDKPPPNSIIFNVKGKEHMSAVGPFVMGTKSVDTITIPSKADPRDFRLHFPNGWDMYVGYDGTTILTLSENELDEAQEENDERMQIVLEPATGRMIINKDKDSRIEIDEDGHVYLDTKSTGLVKINRGGVNVATENHKHGIDGHTHQVVPGALIPGPPATAQSASTPFTKNDPDKLSKHLRVVEE